jgi:hypothetical protein
MNCSFVFKVFMLKKNTDVYYFRCSLDAGNKFAHFWCGDLLKIISRRIRKERIISKWICCEYRLD